MFFDLYIHQCLLVISTLVYKRNIIQSWTILNWFSVGMVVLGIGLVRNIVFSCGCELICTLTTKKNKTVSSMLLMLRWRTWKDSFSKTDMILTSCPSIRLQTTLNTTLEPEILASTLAWGELQHDPTSLKVLVVITFSMQLNGTLVVALVAAAAANADGSSVCWSWGKEGRFSVFRRFLDSRTCTNCCSSLMNSITPPIIEAWSPYNNTSQSSKTRPYVYE